MPQLITNFDYKSPQPNFKRDQVLDHEELRVATLQDYDEGHIVYCLKDRKHYVFATKHNEFGKPIKNEKTGYFSIFNSGSGSGGDEDDVVSEMQTVFAFKSSEETPEKPSGWAWNVIEMHPIPPEDPQGWIIDDSELDPPIWMSIGRFSLLEPEKEDWTTPVRVTGEDGRPGSDGSMLEFVYTRTHTDTINGVTIEVTSPNQCWGPDQDPNKNDAVPNGSWTYKDENGINRTCYWYDSPKGVDSDMQCEWMSQRWKLPKLVVNEETGEEKLESGTWELFTPPVLWSKYGVHGKDGDGIEYIYNLTAKYEAPELPMDILTDDVAKEEFINSEEYQKDGYVPQHLGWTDNPQGPNSAEQYEWVSVRKFNRETGKWGAFSTPTIWATWSREGFKSFVFTRTNDTPATPEDCIDETNPANNTNYENPIPVDPEGKHIWTDGIPGGEEIVWMSSKTFIRGDEDTNRATDWSTPVQMTDTADFDVEFCNSKEFPGDPIDRNDSDYPVDELARDYTTNRDEYGEYMGWYDPNHGDPNTGQKFDTTKAIWMATTKCKNGVWDAWSIVRIKGEKGEDGLKIKVLGTYDTIEDLEAAWLGGTLYGPNPPEIGDAYVIDVLYYDQNRNILHGTPKVDNINVFKETGAFVVWDGDSWVFIGKFTGDSAYLHVRYTNDSRVLTEPENVSDENLWLTPYMGVKKARYIGIATTNSAEAPVTATSYTWVKFVGDDGFGFEYIYILTKTEDAPNVPSVPPVETDENGNVIHPTWDEEGSVYQTFNYVPERPEDVPEDKPWWTDDPTGVSKEWPYEWACLRTYEDNLWGSWKKVTLHSVWSDAGFVSFAFTRTNTDISNYTPTGGSYENPIPDGIDVDPSDDIDGQSLTWYDSVPADGENPYSIVWMTSARFHLGIDGENEKPQWSKPKAMSDTVDLDVDWCPYDENTDPAVTDPGNPETNPSIWWERPYEGNSNDGNTLWPTDENGEYLEPTWMASRKLKNGDTDGPWVITRIKGEKGEKGDKGDNGTSIKPMGSFDFYEDLIAAWLGPDEKEPIWRPDILNEETGEMGVWDPANDGTLTRNPPEDGDAYTINWMYNDKNEKVQCGDMYVYQSEAEDKWVNVGKFKGDPGLNAYVHMKFSANPGVITNPESVDKADLWEKPISVSADGKTITAKYLGVYTDNEKSDSESAEDYEWTKFVGEDGIGYEYVYMRTKVEVAPDVPVYKELDENGEWQEVYWKSEPNDGDIPTNHDDKSPWWTDEVTGVNTDYPYEWVIWRKKCVRNEGDGTYGWGPWTGNGHGKASLFGKWNLQEYSTIIGLVIEPTVVKVDKYGNYSHQNLNVGLYNKKGDEYQALNEIPEGYKIKYKFTNKDNIDVEGSLIAKEALNKDIDIANAYGVIEVGLYNDNDDRIDFESIPVLRDESNLISDLTNDTYTITCDEFGQPINENEVAETTFKLYYGLDEVVAKEISVAIVKEDGTKDELVSVEALDGKEEDTYDDSVLFKVTANINGRIIVTDFDESTPLATNLVITGKVEIAGEELSSSATFTINKLRPGGRAPYMYQLVPSANIIVRDEDGNKTPGEITFDLVQTIENKIEVLSELPKNLSINIYIDGKSSKTLDSGEALANVSVYTKDVAENIQLHLCNEKMGVIHDLYIPLISNGDSAQLYYLNVSPAAVKIDLDNNYSAYKVFPQIIKVRGAQMNTMKKIPDGYSLQYKIDNSDEWVNTGLDGVVIAEKGNEKNGAKSIIQFQLLNDKSVAINRFDVPIVSDGARGEITKAYSIRTSTSTIKVNNTEYDPKTIYANVLCRSGEDVNVLENVNDDYPLFAILNKGSIKTYLDGSEFKEWEPDMSKKLTSYDSISTAHSNCVAIEYYLYKEIDGIWKIIDMESVPYLVDGVDGVDGVDAPVANLTNDMLSIVCNAEGKPENLFEGTTTFEFYLGTNKQKLEELDVENPQSGIYEVTVVDTPSGPSGEVKITARTSKVIPDSTDIVITGTCKTSAGSVSLSKTLKVNKLIIGAPGKDGKDGKSGPIVYPAGIYSINKWYEADDNKAPYVFDPSDNNYYVLNKGTWLGTQHNNRTPSQDYASNNGENWIFMNSFDAIFANIGIIENGLIGSAVFNGDYMFSQLGKTVGNSDTSRYEFFNSTFPYKEAVWKTYTSSKTDNLSVSIKGNIGGHSRITFSDNSYIDTTPYNVLNIDNDLTLVSMEDLYAAHSSILTGTATGREITWKTKISEITLSSNNKYLLHTKSIRCKNAASNKYESYYSEIALLYTYNSSKTIKSIKNYYDYDKFYPNWCVNLRTGEQWIGTGKTYFNSDGSGYLKGDLVADVFNPLYFTEEKSNSFILPKVPENAGKNFSIPYIHASRSIVTFEFITENPTDNIVYTDREGNTEIGTGSLSKEPFMTVGDVGGIGYIDCYGVGPKWHLIERSIKPPTIKFVKELPNSGTEGVLYVLVY